MNSHAFPLMPAVLLRWDPSCSGVGVFSVGSASDSDPGKLANRYDFMAAGLVPSGLLKGPYVSTDFSLPRSRG